MAGFNPVDILNKALYELKQDLRPDDVLDYLLSEGVLTQSEFDRCREHNGRQSQCGELIDILRHKGENGYKHFCIILERTQGHLKTLLDGIARKDGTPKYVYVREIDMEAALRDKDSVITEKDKIIAETEEELQKKNSEIQSIVTSHEDDIKKLKDDHVIAMNKMKEEHAVSIEQIEQEKNKLQTELIQEQERKQAVDQRLEEERRKILDCKKENLQLTNKLVKLEEKYESYTTVQTLKPPKTTESFETTETQERCQAADTEVQRLQTSLADIKHMVSFLEMLLQQQGIHFLKPDPMGVSSLLQCIHLRYDLDRVNLSEVHIDNNGVLVNKAGKGPRGKTSGRFQSYCGTTSTVPLPQTGHLQYMEVVCDVGIDEPLEGCSLVLDLGVCREEEMDVMYCIPDHQYCYCLVVLHCPHHDSVCTYVSKDDKAVHHVSDTLPNTVGSHTTLHYGMVYDSNRKVIVFIDVKGMETIKVLDNVNCDKPMWPMFGVYNPALAAVSMKLVVGNDINMTPEKKAMILKAL